MPVTPRISRPIALALDSSPISRRMLTAAVAGAVIMGGAILSPAQGATQNPRESRDTGFLYVNTRLADGALSLGLTQDAGWMDGTTDLPREALNAVAVHVGDEYKTTVPDDPAWSEYAEPGSPMWSTDGVNGPLSLSFTAIDLDGEQFADPGMPVTLTLEGVRGSNGEAAPGYLWWGSTPPEFNPPSNAIIGSGAEQSKSMPLTPMMNFPASVQAGAAGGYCVDLTVSGTLADGTTVVTSPVTTVAIAVGDQTDPASVVCGDEELIPSASTTRVSVSGGAAFGRARTATVNVAADDQPAAGPVTVKLGTTTLSTTQLTNGRAQVAIPATTPVGTHRISVSYPGSADPGAPVAASSATTSITVAKARPTAKLTLTKKKVKENQRAKVTVRMAIPGAATGIHPTGKIRLYDGNKRIRTVTLTANHKGKITVKLPKLKPGKHKIKATYGGSATTTSKSTTRTTLRVTKK